MATTTTETRTITPTETVETIETAKNIDVAVASTISEIAMHKLIMALKDLSIEEGLNLLKQRGLTVNTTTNVGDSIISYTISSIEYDEFMKHIIKMMVHGGADPNIYNRRESSPLNCLTFHTFYAYSRRDWRHNDCIELLLTAGANPNVIPVSALYCANGSLLKFLTDSPLCTDQVIEMFLKYGAKMSTEEEQEIKAKINSYAKYMHKKEIEQAIKQAKQEVREELYAPGGVGYDLAKMHFTQSTTQCKQSTQCKQPTQCK